MGKEEIKLQNQLKIYAKTLKEAADKNKALEYLLQQIRKDYEEIYSYLLAILNASPGRCLKINFSQFLLFGDQYRLKRDVNSEEKIVFLKLLSARDENAETQPKQ